MLKLHQDRIFAYSSYSNVCRLTFALSVLYLLFCSTFALLYNKVIRQQKLEYILLIFKVIPLTFKNNLRTISGSKSEKFKNIEAQQKATYSYKKECVYRHARAGALVGEGGGCSTPHFFVVV